MRIDVTLPAAVVAPKATPQQPGSSLLFEDLVSPSPDQSAAKNNMAQAQPQQLFSFDALGILGLGGGPQTAPPQLHETGIHLADALTTTAVAMPVVPVSAVPMSNEQQDPHSVPHVMNAGRQGIPLLKTRNLSTGGQLSNGDMLHASLASLDGGVVETVPAVGPNTEVTPPHPEPVPALNTWVSFLVRVETPSTMSVVPSPVSVLSQLRPVMPSANTVADDSSMPAADAPETKEQTTPNDALSPPELVPQVEPSSDSISVTVSETDGAMQVMAAAPDVTDLARLKIRAIAENIAGEIGVKLGEFSLNGATIPHSLKFVEGRPSWQFHL